MNDRSVVVLISANSEWLAVNEILHPGITHSTPFGEYFDYCYSGEKPSNPLMEPLIRFFHGGWGKISASATVQYAIDHWQPDLLVNLGTCGGFDGSIKRGQIILVNKTIVYDILEQMADPAEAIQHYSTDIDLSWLRADYPHPVQPGLLVSADRDIVAGDILGLIDQFGAISADWESGAIAWVAQKNHVRCLILRGVTDLVGISGGEAYANIGLFHTNTRMVMKKLIDQLPDWLNSVQPQTTLPDPLLGKIDCIRLHVPDLESGLCFYRDRLGHELIWHTDKAAGLRLCGTDSELVIQTEQAGQEVDITVFSADQAARRFVDAGGSIVVTPFDIQIGRCAVVSDPWNNHLVLLDSSKGLLATDKSGNVLGNL